jgi:PAS domain S-box-containing protein
MEELATSVGRADSDVVARDSSEPRRGHERERLRQIEERFRLLVEGVKDYAIFMLDPHGYVASWNNGAERINGYRESEIVGRHFSAFYPEEDLLAGKCEIELEHAARDGRFEDEGWRLRKDGSRFWANVVITPMRGPTQELLGFAKITRDLTERRAAELERTRVGQQARERLHALATLAEALAVTLTLEQVGSVAVERAADLVRADVCSVHVLDEQSRQLALVAEYGLDRRTKESLRVLGSDHPLYEIGAGGKAGVWIENPAQQPAVLLQLSPTDGAEIDAAFACVPLLAEGRSFGMLSIGFREARSFSEDDREFIGTFARQCAQATARARRLAAERRAKDEFLAVVSHELRTPLNAIAGWAQLLGRQDLDERRRAKGVDTIARNASAMTRLIEDLLDSSRATSGKLQLQLQLVDLTHVITTALDSLRPTATARGVALVSNLPPEAPRMLGDPPRLQQILANLLSNAIKFSYAGAAIEVALRASETELEVSVKDFGRGIAPEFLPYVFEPFRQQDGSSSRGYGGLGLGLSISRQLVELHGGHIVAHSQGPGHGATFTMAFPASTAQASPDSRAATSAVALGNDAGDRPAQVRGVGVLVVDDDDDARELVASILEDCGCRVCVARSAAEAMQRLSEDHPDVLLSDIGMPGEDGYALIRKVRALPSEHGGKIPAAAVTAFTRPDDRRKVFDAGYLIHLPKPVEPTELIAVVSTLSRFAVRASGTG